MAYTTIDDPEAYFQVRAYAGNGTDDTGITLDGDTALSPNFVIIKDRTEGNWFDVFDTVRGATKRVYTNTTNAEETQAASLQSFDADGFTLGTNVDVNKDGNNYVAWCWKANGSGSSNTDGDITTTVSANTTSGISICKYSGNGTNDQELGHGMNKIPDIWFIKRTDSGCWSKTFRT